MGVLDKGIEGLPIEGMGRGPLFLGHYQERRRKPNGNRKFRPLAGTSEIATFVNNSTTAARAIDDGPVLQFEAATSPGGGVKNSRRYALTSCRTKGSRVRALHAER